MKITELQFDAFRSWVTTALNVDAPRVLLAGLNGSGKSSVRDGIAYALTGKIPGVDHPIEAGADLVPVFLGVPKAGCSVVVDGMRVQREWNPGQTHLRVTGFTGTPTVQQQALYEKLGVSEAVLHACLDARAFLHLHHAQAKALLLGLLNVTVSVGIGDGVSTYTLDELDAAYKTAFEDRKLAKNRLKGLSVPEKPTWPLPNIPQHPVEAYEGRMAELRSQLSDAQTALGTVTGKRQTLENRRRQLLQLPVGAIDPAPLLTQVEELEERLAILEAEVVPPAPQAPIVHDASRAGTERLIVALVEHKPTKGCVLDPEVRCDTHKSHFTKRAKALQEELDALPAVAAPPVTDTPASPLTVMRRRLQDLKRQYADGMRAVEANETREKDLLAVGTELSSLPDTTEQEQILKALQEKIQMGESVIRAARVFYAASASHDKAVQATIAAQADVDRLEELVAVLGPTGARVGALTEAVGAFEGAVNPFLEPFGWTLKIQVEPWDVRVNERPAETYSLSERFRIGVGLQLAIAQMSGLNFAVVDELDILDGDNRKIVGRMLYQSEVGQILILRTTDAEVPLPDPAKTPGMLSIRVQCDKGRSTVVERTDLVPA